MLFSQNYACDDCGISIEELTPRMFSFNNPYGACPTCTGLGMQKRVDPDAGHSEPATFPSSRALYRAPGWGNADTGSIAAMYLQRARQKVRLYAGHAHRGVAPSRHSTMLLYGTNGDEPLELSVKRAVRAA